MCETRRECMLMAKYMFPRCFSLCKFSCWGASQCQAARSICLHKTYLNICFIVKIKHEHLFNAMSVFWSIRWLTIYAAIGLKWITDTCINDCITGCSKLLLQSFLLLKVSVRDTVYLFFLEDTVTAFKGKKTPAFWLCLETNGLLCSEVFSAIKCWRFYCFYRH